MFYWKNKQRLVYLRECVSVGYSTVDVIWRSRKGFSCSQGTTVGRQALETMITFSEIYWSEEKRCTQSCSPQEFLLETSV